MLNINTLPTPSLTRTTFPTDDDFVQIGRVDGAGSTCTRILCKKITKEEVDILQEEGYINLNINNMVIKIDASQCYAFGEIDFNNQEDIQLIRSFKWMNDLKPSSFVPRHYNYSSHTGDVVNGRLAYVETYDNFLALKYAHGRLKKPKYIALISLVAKLPYSRNYKTD